MKYIIITIGIMLFTVSAVMAQGNLLTLTGGYAWSKLETSEISATGYRINVMYEINPNETVLSHGVSVGYIRTNADSAGIQDVKYKVNSWPIYYAPKVIFGGSNLKVFIKGALGIHFSNDIRTSNILEVKTSRQGFYGGIGAGLSYFVKENIFLDADYEWAFMGNVIYNNGFINTINFGVGMKL